MYLDFALSHFYLIERQADSGIGRTRRSANLRCLFRNGQPIDKRGETGWRNDADAEQLLLTAGRVFIRN